MGGKVLASDGEWIYRGEDHPKYPLQTEGKGTRMKSILPIPLICVGKGHFSVKVQWDGVNLSLTMTCRELLALIDGMR